MSLSYFNTGSSQNLILMLIIAISGGLLGYFYTATPIRLVSRYGLGELTIFLTFGPLLTLGSGYALSVNTIEFLSTEFQDCKSSIENGIASARIMPSKKNIIENDGLRVAIDGDSVIFSEESQKIYEEYGLEAFDKNEKSLANKPLSGGSFKPFLNELFKIQQLFSSEECPLRIALVTARSAPSHERVIRTLREWNIRVDEALFLGGVDKASFLKDFGADIFFDDQIKNCISTCLEVPTGQVINFNTRNYAQ